MDLKEELLAVLDNPARVWDAVVTNLATEPRMALLVLTTCKTPISLIEWQEALARVSTEAAVKFEASLRVLDDSFVTTTRAENSHRVEFRNPSMDDFCASYLDRNVGIATTVVSRDPALHQIKRLIELGTSYDVGERKGGVLLQRRFPNIHGALIADPSVLLLRLLDIMPIGSLISRSLSEAILTTLTLLSQAEHLSEKITSSARARLFPTIMHLRFGADDSFLFSALDDHARARALANILGSDFDTFYEKLVESADALSHFDTLVNIDEALGWSSTDVDWAERFEQLTDGWLGEDDSSGSSLEGSRDMYEKVAQHLEIDRSDTLREWDEMIRRAESSTQSDDDDDPDWRRESEQSASAVNNDLESRQIDAMFAGLSDPYR